MANPAAELLNHQEIVENNIVFIWKRNSKHEPYCGCPASCRYCCNDCCDLCIPNKTNIVEEIASVPAELNGIVTLDELQQVSELINDIYHESHFPICPVPTCFCLTCAPYIILSCLRGFLSTGKNVYAPVIALFNNIRALGLGELVGKSPPFANRSNLAFQAPPSATLRNQPGDPILYLIKVGELTNNQTIKSQQMDSNRA
jgi:hypothetical protein